MITYSISPITIIKCLELTSMLRTDGFKQNVDWDFSYINPSEHLVDEQRRWVRIPAKMHLMIYDEKMAIYFMLKYSDLHPVEITENLEE